jgi:hypothetical protein
MSAFISKKLSLILLLCSWCAALAITLLMNYALAGPRLGKFYDTLLDFRIQPPVSREILLVATDEVIEPGDLFSTLMALSEMGASDLLVEVPVLGTGSGLAETGREFSYRVNDEFSLLGRNIRNLFEAIRMGMVSPIESPSYVESLVELSERGRDRLNSALIRQDEEGSVLATQAAAVFEKALFAADLRPPPLSGTVSAGDIPWYSLPRPDHDGVLRRIAPSAEIEHIAYHALKGRWEKSAVEYGGGAVANSSRLFLINQFERNGEDMEYRFPLDRDRNILIDRKTLEKDRVQGFRRLTLQHFRDYEQTGRVLARLLKDAESLGVYAGTMPERIPLRLYEYAERLKEDLLKNPSEAGRAAWIDARAEYIASLNEFLYGASETNLVNGYEELIATEKLGEAGIARLRGLRDELIRSFSAMKEKHLELSELRALLANEISASFCIMGPAFSTARVNTPGSSALLSNALLTGHSITPGQDRYIILWSVVVSFLLLACIHALKPALLLTMGLAVNLLCGAVFSLSFIISGYWIDPCIPTAALLGGTLVLFVSRFCISHDRTLRFRLAYTKSLNSTMLKTLVKAGHPLLSETLCAQAVIIAVKNPGMPGREDRETPLEASRSAVEFRREFSRLFKQQGALILGFENDIALACFGSPPQRTCREDTKHPAARAISCIRAILQSPLSSEWRFGIESGECAFSWSVETGYTANGHPVARARIFAALAMRFKVRAIIGRSASRSNGQNLRKIASLAGESFYELPIGERGAENHEGRDGKGN